MERFLSVTRQPDAEIEMIFFEKIAQSICFKIIVVKGGASFQLLGLYEFSVAKGNTSPVKFLIDDPMVGVLKRGKEKRTWTNYPYIFAFSDKTKNIKMRLTNERLKRCLFCAPVDGDVLWNAGCYKLACKGRF